MGNRHRFNTPERAVEVLHKRVTPDQLGELVRLLTSH